MLDPLLVERLMPHARTRIAATPNQATAIAMGLLAIECFAGNRQ